MLGPVFTQRELDCSFREGALYGLILGAAAVLLVAVVCGVWR